MQPEALSMAMWRGDQLYSPWYLNNTIRDGRGNIGQIPPDLVVKSQTVDIVEII